MPETQFNEEKVVYLSNGELENLTSKWKKKKNVNLDNEFTNLIKLTQNGS